MYLLCQCEAREHDEGVAEVDEGAVAGVLVGHDGALPDGGLGVAVGTGKVVVVGASPLMHYCAHVVTLFTVGCIVQKSFPLQELYCRVKGSNFIGQSDEVVCGARHRNICNIGHTCIAHSTSYSP